ncbi:hypothetical protein ACJX0J_034315, partial [Zea mays]
LIVMFASICFARVCYTRVFQYFIVLITLYETFLKKYQLGLKKNLLIKNFPYLAYFTQINKFYLLLEGNIYLRVLLI